MRRAEIDKLESQIYDLENENSDLKDEIEQLETRIYELEGEE